MVVIQTNLLNETSHPSSIVCPLTTNVQTEAEILRIHVKKGEADLDKDCDIMMDQGRAIDNKRLVKKIGTLHTSHIEKIKESLSIILDL